MSNSKPVEDDEWETDPDFINDVSEKDQRWLNFKSCVGETKKH